MGRAPKVSVLLAVHNDARFISATLDSILAQDFTDFELVLIDDASSDGTADIVKGVADPRIRYSRNGVNAGLAASLNRGLEMCEGEFIARIDGDDLCEPQRLTVQLQYLADHADLAGCASWTTEIDENDAIIGALEPCADPDYVRWSLCHTNRLYHPSMMLRRAVFELSGRYDPDYLATEDYELWTRMIAGGARLGIVPRRLIRYRRRAGSITSTHVNHQRRVGSQIASRYISQLIGHPCDEPTVALMRSLMSWQQAGFEPITREQVKAVTSLMGAVRQAALAGRDPAVRRSRAAADAEVADRLCRQARAMLKDAPSAAASLGAYVARLPGHRSEGLKLIATAGRCAIGRWRHRDR